jgi:hypothetical protein
VAEFSSFPSFSQAASGLSVLDRFSNLFPDPFFDYASTQMPRSLYDVLRWCEYLWLTNGTYRMAAQRVVRYFITEIELEDIKDEEKEKFEEFLERVIRVKDILAQLGDDWMAYGNSFSSIYVPFRRHLKCRHCYGEFPLKQISYSFQSFKFQATCPVCKWTGQFERIDRRSIEQDRIRVIRWSPHEMQMMYHPISHDTTFLWRPPADFKNLLRRGAGFYLESTPWEIIEAVKANKLFRFNDGYVYHMKEDTLAGIKNVGWGIPRIIANFKQAWYVQVLKRYNEALALDYIVPFRVITPKPGSSREADPLLHANIGSFNARVTNMIREHRLDPATWHTLPFPVEYQAMSGEGNALAPSELLTLGQDELLNAIGVPAEMYKGTLNVNAAPMALRLFDKTWTHFVSALNGWLNWFFESVSALQNWEDITGRLQPSTMAEDVEKKHIQLQLAAAQQISRQTAYSPFGIDFREEVRRMFEEEKQFQEEMRDFQKQQQKSMEMEQTFEAAQMPSGGMGGMPPGGGGGGMPVSPGAPIGPTPPGTPAGPVGPQPGASGVTPEDLMMQAEQMAYQALQQPYELRRSFLAQIKRSNETLHSLVIAQMQKIRQTARTQGGYQQLQAQVGAAV